MKIKNVLLIDDDEVDHYITLHVLKKQNVAENIIMQPSAIDALTYLEYIMRNSPHKIPEYIFLDIRMPEMDGFGFLDEFIKLPEAISKYCRIVMLSSSYDPNDVERALKYPVVRKFFSKPLTKEMLDSL